MKTPPSRLGRAAFVAWSFVMLTALSPEAKGQVRYDFILVDSLNANPLAGESRLANISDQGIACGVTTIDNVIGYPAMIWRETTGRTRIPIADPQDINSSGLIVGNNGIYDLVSGQTITPPILPGTYFGPFLGGVNESGIAVGSISTCSCSDSGGVLRVPYVWDAVNGASILSIPDARGLKRINSTGTAIGWLNGWVLDDGFSVDLNTGAVVYLADVFPAILGSGPVRAADINDRGDIVGSRAGAFPVYRYGYVYRPGSGVEILPFPGAGYQQYIAPAAINNAGTIVGAISTELASQHVFVYSQADGLRDLNVGTLIAGMPAGYRLYAATAINNNGWIVGYGNTAAGKVTGFVLRPRRPACIADIDDGTSTGTPDGGVTIDDLLYYLVVFDAGTSRADVDDGSGTGTPDGGVTIDDLLYYLVRFENGC